MPSPKTKVAWFIGCVLIAAAGFYLFNSFLQATVEEHKQKRPKRPTPVETAMVNHGRLSLWRTYNGTIEPRSQFIVAPKVSGRIQKLLVDVSDRVVRGQQIVQMEDAEYEQAVIEAKARLAVAEANRAESVSKLEIAQRELDRTKTLFDRGVASESAFDSAKARFLTSQAAVKVAEANITREKALLRSSRIRLGYTKVEAEWIQGDNERTVAERFVDEGNTVAANTPLLSIVEIDPVIAVIQVTEKEYPLIKLGQQAKVQTDAYPDKIFPGTVTRIAPIFRESSRQARLELTVDNPDFLLKPGMFSRCTLELERVENGVSVPLLAITNRGNRSGLFKVTDDGTSVEWIEVTPGFISGDFIQILSPDLSGRVVTLGQQLIKDGSQIHIAEESESTTKLGGIELK